LLIVYRVPQATHIKTVPLPFVCSAKKSATFLPILELIVIDIYGSLGITVLIKCHDYDPAL